jgi:hypothetical protein
MYDSVRHPAGCRPRCRPIQLDSRIREEDQTTVATKRGKSSASSSRSTRPTTPRAAAKAPARPAAGRPAAKSAAAAKPTAVTKPAAAKPALPKPAPARPAAAKPAPPKPAPAGPAAAKPAPAKPEAARPAAARAGDAGAGRGAAPGTAPAPRGPSLLERAEQLRDVIQRSKLTHPDPWTFSAKARGWSQRAQVLVQEVAASGDTPANRRSVETLAAEVEGDPSFQEARRLF